MILHLGCSIFSQGDNLIHFSIGNGLTTNLVYGLIQDHKGYIWFYTNDGVIKFDGHRFKTFNVKNGLSNNDVWGLIEDSKGKIWCNSYSDRVDCIDEDTVKSYFKNINSKFNNNNEPITSVYYQAGKLYAKFRSIMPAVLFKDTFVIDKNIYNKIAIELDKYSNHNEIRLSNFINLFQLISITPKYIEIYNLMTNEIKKVPHNIVDLDHYRLLGTASINQKEIFLDYNQERNSIVLINENKYNVIELSNKGWEKLINPPYIQTSNSMIQVSNPNGQLIIIDTNLNLIETIYNPIVHQKMEGKPFMDRDGNYWMSYLGKGAYLLPRSKRLISQSKFGNTNRIVEPISIMNFDNEFYIGCKPNAVYKLNKAYKPIKILEAVDKPGSKISSFITTNDKLYFNHNSINFRNRNGQLGKFDLSKTKFSDKNFKDFINKTDFIVFKSIYMTSNGNFVLGLIRNCLYLDVKRDSIRTICKKPIYVITGNENEEIWMGSTNGIEYWNTSMKSSKPILTDQIKNQTEALKYENDKLYIGTNGAGFFVYDFKSKNLRSVHLPANVIRNIFIIDSTIWLSTSSGAFALNKWTFQIEAELNQYNALPSNIVNAIWAKKDTALILTQEGMSIVPLDLFRHAQSNIPHITISGLWVNNHKVRNLENLSPNDKNIKVEFTTFQYSKFNQQRYLYKINDNATWQISKNGEIELLELSPQRYKLDIYPEGSPNKMYTLYFQIPRHWYYSDWFMTFVVLVVIFISYMVYKNQIRKIRGKLNHENSQNKKIAELELKALQSQMNPHFIFNSLGSIQYYQQHNVDLADTYLSKFARLMRLFLESSKKKMVNINEEVSLLSLYLEMEKLRLGDQLTFDIQVDPEIDGLIDEVPSMIIQPFVENAVNHGIFHKDTPGHISIHFALENDQFIKITIEDNGIGRERANILKSNMQPLHTSRAMQIVEEKLDIMKQQNNNSIDFQIIDKMDDLNNATGTKIIITLSL